MSEGFLTNYSVAQGVNQINNCAAYPTFKRVSCPGNASPLLVQRHETAIASCRIKENINC